MWLKCRALKALLSNVRCTTTSSPPSVVVDPPIRSELDRAATDHRYSHARSSHWRHAALSIYPRASSIRANNNDDVVVVVVGPRDTWHLPRTKDALPARSRGSRVRRSDDRLLADRVVLSGEPPPVGSARGFQRTDTIPRQRDPDFTAARVL